MRKHLLVGVASNGSIYLDIFRDYMDGSYDVNPLVILPNWLAFLALVTAEPVTRAFEQRKINAWRVYPIDETHPDLEHGYTRVNPLPERIM